MTQVLKSIRELRIILAKSFDKSFIGQKLKKRSGKCQKCGKCCKNCKHLNKKTKLCKIYGKRSRFTCYLDFPLDKEDQRLWKVEKTCGYRFKK